MKIFRGRLSKQMDPKLSEFIGSIEEDMKIAEIDIDVIKAHSTMLNKVGIINDEDLKKILKALEKARKDLISGKIDIKGKIDIHPLIEEYIIEECGIEVGGKTHTGKSRNDQVMADMHIFVRNGSLRILRRLLDLIRELLEIAEKNKETVMPAYTHLQHAQVTTYAHYLLCYVDAFLRDAERILTTLYYLNLNPLGSNACAGSSIEIDRECTTELLGFEGVLENSLDATSNRDILLDSISRLVLLLVTISRMSRDIIIWSTYEFGFLELADEVADVSTSMPQKKNPDVLEVICGKTGKALGNLVHCFSTVYCLPTGYSRDLQEVKASVIEVVEIAEEVLEAFSKVVSKIILKPERMREVITENYVLAVDLTELLVKKGIPFREAHFIVGKLVRKLIEEGKKLSEISPKDLVEECRKIGREVEIGDEELKNVTDPLGSVYAKRTVGSPNPAEVERMIRDRKSKLDKFFESLKNYLDYKY